MKNRARAVEEERQPPRLPSPPLTPTPQPIVDRSIRRVFTREHPVVAVPSAAEKLPRRPSIES